MELIVNVARNGGIGFQGDQLFYIREDLRRFRRLTAGKTIIMGRRTLQALPGGKPLPDRTNLILSDTLPEVPGAEVFSELSALLRHLSRLDRDQVFVIGGGSVYRALLPYCHRARLTRTDAAPDADTFFPELQTMPGWKLESVSAPMEEQGLVFRYEDYGNLHPLLLPE